MKIIAFDNDVKGMAIRFLSQELRLGKPGCSIIVCKCPSLWLPSLPKPDADFVFINTPFNPAAVLAYGGKIYHLKSIFESIKDYHAEVMALLPEFLI